MKLKDVIQGRFEKVSEELLPQLLDTWGDLQRRLDELNCSLANRAVPETRRSRVSELSLQQKASRAGQGGADVTVLKRSRKQAESK
ncbi:MAG: hypothetical protein EP328_10725 [Gammaproteobacteria bacterium]|nr:MAG: hypothetical protein EP328_10725 [Gammaproteobacteria bacterium]